MWELHDRLEGEITPETCREEILSFAKHGQLVPALARPLRANREHDFELIYGARRLFVAQHVNTPLLVEIRELTDREAIAAMDIENRQRKDISPYERGLSYALWMREGHFESQEEIARFLKVSASQVSRLLRLARLPSVIVSAFGSGSEICESWGLDLADALDDPQRRQATIQCARAITLLPERPRAQEIYRRLLAAAARGRKVRGCSHDEVVSGEDGSHLFRIRFQRSSVALVVPANTVSAQALAKMRRAVAEILQDETSQVVDSRTRRLRVRREPACAIAAQE